MTDRNYPLEEEGLVSAPLLTVPEAAEYLGVGRRVIYELIERGEITAVRAGRSTRIEKNSLEKFRSGARLM